MWISQLTFNSVDTAFAVGVDAFEPNEHTAHYFRVGAALRTRSRKVRSIQNEIMGVTPTSKSLPRMFYYVNGSSGLGKTQLAFCLDVPTLYIPIGEYLVSVMHGIVTL
jgi:hypothetical protein